MFTIEVYRSGFSGNYFVRVYVTDTGETYYLKGGTTLNGVIRMAMIARHIYDNASIVFRYY